MKVKVAPVLLFAFAVLVSLRGRLDAQTPALLADSGNVSYTWKSCTDLEWLWADYCSSKEKCHACVQPPVHPRQIRAPAPCITGKCSQGIAWPKFRKPQILSKSFWRDKLSFDMPCSSCTTAMPLPGRSIMGECLSGCQTIGQGTFSSAPKERYDQDVQAGAEEEPGAPEVPNPPPGGSEDLELDTPLATPLET